jgi:hypothetical protein
MDTVYILAVDFVNILAVDSVDILAVDIVDIFNCRYFRHLSSLNVFMLTLVGNLSVGILSVHILNVDILTHWWHFTCLYFRCRQFDEIHISTFEHLS